MLAIAYWAIAASTNTSEGYVFASLASLGLLTEAVQPWMRRKGLPDGAPARPTSRV